MSAQTTAPAPTTTPTATDHPVWRRAAAVAALAAPLAYALSAAVGVAHTDNTDRQLDIIAAHTGSFTAMVLLEQVCYVLASATAVAVAIRLASSRGSRLAGVAAVLVAIGAAANLGGFGGALPTLVRHDRATARYFVDHLGPIYTTSLALAILLQIGLVLMLVALWRSRAVALPWLVVSAIALAASVVIGTGRVENTVAMLVLAGGFVGIARFLARPAVSA